MLFTRTRIRKTAPPQLQRLFLIEHELLQTVAYRHLRRHPFPGSTQPLLNTINGWRSCAGGAIDAYELVDVNGIHSHELLDRIRPDVTVSVRCYQKFTPTTIAALSTSPCRPFLNLHPGRLPSYRGVNPFAWSMLNQDERAAWTLHHIDVDFDTGAIVDGVEVPLDYAESVHENLLRSVPCATDLVWSAIRTAATGGTLARIPQDDTAARYYSFLDSKDLRQLETQGITMCRPEPVIGTVLRAARLAGATRASVAELATKMLAAVESNSACLRD
ncbi:hypothetical protein B1987_03330 [Mycobacterium kansasii]|uniref:Methionyl-tRNA formyltransferase n=1 Tax=Mycobacterium attenuatum TaxID=2341086 RepID=A0A498Q293_9MYCO|nr:hypothetical protein B1987_03330 [Mycobacterium kansasii]VBA40248.1 Methionyl-tRNA formyltransferase [Mycobacterium attenuatum]VBA55553.1 Methionyl-tRNA formyltransferase [Mycobacterium attenuatum]VBA59434.1 Methionyl-tRNA formyltransferase [Mycobacterium attenuatum]